MFNKFSWILVISVFFAKVGTCTQPKVAGNENAPAVIFLLDEKWGVGHAALLVRGKEGWDYFSFGPNSKKGAGKSNLVHQHYDSLKDAVAAPELKRYTKYLSWTTSDHATTEAVRRHVLKEWNNNSEYRLGDRNCCTMVTDAIHAGSFTINKGRIPAACYRENQSNAKSNGTSHGAWPLAQL